MQRGVENCQEPLLTQSDAGLLDQVIEVRVTVALVTGQAAEQLIRNRCKGWVQ